MKYIYILSMVVAVAMTEEFYQTNTKNFKVEKVADDKEELSSYIQCFIDKKPCEGFAAELKKNTRDAINNGCKKCTDSQKHVAKVLLEAFNKVPEDYQLFKNFYDPQGTLLPVLIQNTASY